MSKGQHTMEVKIKKKSKVEWGVLFWGFIIICGILAALGFGGKYCYDHFFNKKKDGQETVETDSTAKPKQLKVDSSRVTPQPKPMPPQPKKVEVQPAKKEEKKDQQDPHAKPNDQIPDWNN